MSICIAIECDIFNIKCIFTITINTNCTDK